MLENCRVIAAATDLPVNADLENGYADEPRAAAEMIRLAAEAGVVGGLIEDATGDPAGPSTTSICRRARPGRGGGGAVAARAVRADGAGREPATAAPTSTTPSGGQAFEKAGADVLYAPGVRDLATIRTVASSVGKLRSTS